MKPEDVKIGMKVVPHTKSLYSSWEGWKSDASENFKFFQKNGYLFVKSIDKSVINLANTISNAYGSTFDASDFEPYKEAKKIVFVKHDGNRREFTFEVPFGFDVKCGDKILCQTCHGEQMGTVTAGPFAEPETMDALIYATGCYLPLKLITGKYEIVRPTSVTDLSF